MPPDSARPPHDNPACRDILVQAVESAIRAPSSHNTQPWLFRIGEDQVELYADRRRSLPVVDPEDRELTISCGAALFNLCLSIRHQGRATAVEVLADRNLDRLALVRIGAARSAAPEEESLSGAISRRRTNRLPFEQRPIPNDVISALERAAQAEGAMLDAVTGLSKNALVDLIAEGDRIQAADTSFRRELAAWVHPNRAKNKDGMPAGGFGAGDMASLVFPLILRTFDWGKGQAARDRQLAAGSPALAVLTTGEDNPAAWLKAGQALERVLLTAVSHGLSASFLNQPIESPSLRIRLADLLGVGEFPQLILRMGYGRDVSPTPRRDLADVLI